MGPLFGEGMNGAAVQGVVSRSVRDTAASLDVLQGPEPHAPYFMAAPPRPYLEAASEPLRPLRIGFSSASPLGTEVHPEARKAGNRLLACSNRWATTLKKPHPPSTGCNCHKTSC